MHQKMTRRGVFGLLGALAAVAVVPAVKVAEAAPVAPEPAKACNAGTTGAMTGTLTVSGNLTANHVMLSTGPGISSWGHTHSIGLPYTGTLASGSEPHAHSVDLPVPAGALAYWPMTGDPPAGWTRYTALDGRYITKLGTAAGDA